MPWVDGPILSYLRRCWVVHTLSVFLAGATSCSPSNHKKLLLYRLSLDLPAAWALIPLQREQLRQHLLNIVHQDNDLQTTKIPQQATHSLSVRITPRVDALQTIFQDPMRFPYALTVVLLPLASGQHFQVTDALSSLDLDEVTKVFGRNWQQLQNQRHRAQASDAILLADLCSSDVATRFVAIDALAQRRQKEAVPFLCNLLTQHASFEEAMRVIGALLALHDRRAVLPLIDWSRHQKLEALTAVILALSQLGGRLATAFLITLASGHDDEIVRNAAAEALHSLGINSL